jgi:hypothetical protein
MSERLRAYDVAVVAGGVTWRAEAWGRQREDGLWEGWLRFVPVNGGDARRTDRETTQPNRSALEYWASGLEPVYLEGAFERAGYS